MREQSRKPQTEVTQGVTQAKRGFVTPNVRRAIISFYNGACQYCGAAGADQIDHIHPVTCGGADAIENLTLACRWCNARKGAMVLDPMASAIAAARAVRSSSRILALLSPGARRTRAQRLRECPAPSRSAAACPQTLSSPFVPGPGADLYFLTEMQLGEMRHGFPWVPGWVRPPPGSWAAINQPESSYAPIRYDISEED